MQQESSVMQSYSAQTLEDARWTCETCGVIAGRVVALPGRPVYYARNECPCQIAKREQKIAEEKRSAWTQMQKKRTFSWLGEKWDDSPLLNRTFDNFNQMFQGNAYQIVQSFIFEMRGTLVLHGTYGTGKTHLLAALCNELRTAGKSSLFTTAPKLFSAIQSRYALHEDPSSIISEAIKTNLLVIDDLGREKPSEFREEVYDMIIDGRSVAGRPIAISTNKLSELKNYLSGAALSRLQIGQIDVEMNGMDYRKVLEVS